MTLTTLRKDRRTVSRSLCGLVCCETQRKRTIRIEAKIRIRNICSRRDEAKSSQRRTQQDIGDCGHGARTEGTKAGVNVFNGPPTDGPDQLSETDVPIPEMVDLTDVSPETAAPGMMASSSGITVATPRKAAMCPRVAGLRRQFRRVRCGHCPACVREDCRYCVYCRDMRKYGGAGRLKQRCITKRCLAPILPKAAVCIICRKGKRLDHSYGQSYGTLMECHICWETVHTNCFSKLYEIFGANLGSGIICADLPNRWKCPRCCFGTKEQMMNQVVKCRRGVAGKTETPDTRLMTSPEVKRMPSPDVRRPSAPSVRRRQRMLAWQAGTISCGATSVHVDHNYTAQVY